MFLVPETSDSSRGTGHPLLQGVLPIFRLADDEVIAAMMRLRNRPEPRDAQMDRLNGKIALVTGGTSGVGMAAAERFHQEGARVAIVGRNESRLRDVADAMGEGVRQRRHCTRRSDRDHVAAARRFDAANNASSQTGLPVGGAPIFSTSWCLYL
jgi:NADPH:quinone reductase-like Zn-dependent oxidoreductase